MSGQAKIGVGLCEWLVSRTGSEIEVTLNWATLGSGIRNGIGATSTYASDIQDVRTG